MNGGLTPTHALLPTSPALDLVPATAPCPDVDQRGAPRPEDGDGDGDARCDAGSYELQPPPVVEIPTLGEAALWALIVLLASAVVPRRLEALEEARRTRSGLQDVGEVPGGQGAKERTRLASVVARRVAQRTRLAAARHGRVEHHHLFEADAGTAKRNRERRP